MADPAWKMGLGLVTGVAFGFLLQKAWVTKPRAIVGAFLVRDLTAAKVMATAAAVGAAGVWMLHAAGGEALEPKPLRLAGILAGGVLFGVGIVLYGYCPGTGVAASGEGRTDARVGILGMMTGAGVYVLGYPLLEPLIKSLGDQGKISFPQLTETSPLIWAAALAAATFGAFSVGEKLTKKRHPRLPLRPDVRYSDARA